MSMIRKILTAASVTVIVLCSCVAKAQVVYEILPASTIRISGTSTLSDWVVSSQKVSGEMNFIASAKQKPGATPAGTIKSATAVLEVSSIKSEKGETMDNKMYSALKIESYPEIRFSLTKPIDVAGAPANLSATGNVNMAGVTRPLTFDLTLTYAENAFHFQGKRSLKLSDFEIDPPTAMFGQIVTGDEIVVELNLSFGK